MLLRYPVPKAPIGPQSFAEDALYLRQNLNQEGGRYLVSKYAAGGESESLRISGSRRIKRAASRQQQRGSRSSLSPRMSPARFLQEHGGIDGIIQEAAKGVSSRGEKWGVSAALRGAYEGLQSAGSTPRRLGVAPRWPLDTSNYGANENANLIAKMQSLEQRNIGLAKLLEKALEDLWIQQRELMEENSKQSKDSLSLAIAKVQFVQVYLENPTMPLPTEEAPRGRIEDSTLHRMSSVDHESPTRNTGQTQSPTRKAPVKDGRRKSKPEGQGASSQVSPRSPLGKATTSETPIESIPSLELPKDTGNSTGSPRSRPALAQSSFSWMLGQDQRISEFVAASPFSTEKERSRGRAGFLFGDDEAGDGNESSPTRKAKRGAKDAKKGDKDVKREKDAEEAITMTNMAISNKSET